MFFSRPTPSTILKDPVSLSIILLSMAALVDSAKAPITRYFSSTAADSMGAFYSLVSAAKFEKECLPEMVQAMLLACGLKPVASAFGLAMSEVGSVMNGQLVLNAGNRTAADQAQLDCMMGYVNQFPIKYQGEPAKLPVGLIVGLLLGLAAALVCCAAVTIGSGTGIWFCKRNSSKNNETAKTLAHMESAFGSGKDTGAAPQGGTEMAWMSRGAPGRS